MHKKEEEDYIRIEDATYQTTSTKKAQSFLILPIQVFLEFSFSRNMLRSELSVF